MKWSRRKPAGRIAYVDGRYLRHGEAGVHIEDRGLQLGDAIYEVWRLSAGRLLDLEEHLDRLERSLREIAITIPMTRAALKHVLGEIVRRNLVTEAIVYLQITRGAVKRDHPIPVTPPKPTVILTVHRLDPAALQRRLAEGVSAITAPDTRWARCDIKSTQLLANLLAKTEARRSGAYEALFVDDAGFITEGASTNVWIVDRAGQLVTRALSEAILPGVTRRVVLELARNTGISVIERAFTPAEAKQAQEVFLTSATGAAVPIIAIDDTQIGQGQPGPVTLGLQGLYAAHG